MVTMITSPANPKVKEALKLRDRRERHQTGLFLVEGLKEIASALKAGVNFVTLFFCEDLLKTSAEKEILSAAQRNSCHIIQVSRLVLEKLAYRGDSSGMVIVAKRKTMRMEDFVLGACPLLVVIEGAEKPGNIGAVLRSADAAGVNGVIICSSGTDLYNPNTIRASLGTLFSVQVAEADPIAAASWLRSNGIRTFAASPHAEKAHYHANFSQPCAILLGSEHEGLSDACMRSADELLRIPMSGHSDSLNLSTSAAVLLYEVVRQREYA